MRKCLANQTRSKQRSNAGAQDMCVLMSRRGVHLACTNPPMTPHVGTWEIVETGCDVCMLIQEQHIRVTNGQPQREQREPQEKES